MDCRRPDLIVCLSCCLRLFGSVVIFYCAWFDFISFLVPLDEVCFAIFLRRFIVVGIVFELLLGRWCTDYLRRGLGDIRSDKITLDEQEGGLLGSCSCFAEFLDIQSCLKIVIV